MLVKGRLIGARLSKNKSSRKPHKYTYGYSLIHSKRKGLRLSVSKYLALEEPAGDIEVKDSKGLAAFLHFEIFKESRNGCMRLSDVVVSSELRKEGIFLQLYSEAEQIALEHGIQKIKAEVLASNSRSLEVFKKLGFRQVGKFFMNDPLYGKGIVLKLQKNLAKAGN